MPVEINTHTHIINGEDAYGSSQEKGAMESDGTMSGCVWPWQLVSKKLAASAKVGTCCMTMIGLRHAFSTRHMGNCMFSGEKATSNTSVSGSTRMCTLSEKSGKHISRLIH